jgi:hypothetical protein
VIGGDVPHPGILKAGELYPSTAPATDVEAVAWLFVGALELEVSEVKFMHNARPTSPADELHADLNYALQERAEGGDSHEKLESIAAEVRKVVIGQDRLAQQVMWAILSDGYALLEGVPGLAKTLLISAIAKASGGVFRRIQLLPDLMPSNITGTLIFRNDTSTFEVHPGPIIGAPRKRKRPFCRSCRSGR